MQKNFSLKDRNGFKPIKKYPNFILFEKDVNGSKIHTCYNYVDIPSLYLTEEDREWIERS